MAVKEANDDDLRSLIFQHDMVIVMYLIENCAVCNAIGRLYLKQSDRPIYNNIIFLKINAAESVVAAKIVGETGNPFIVSYKTGFLVRCEEVKTEKKLLKILTELKDEHRPNFGE